MLGCDPGIPRIEVLRFTRPHVCRPKRQAYLAGVEEIEIHEILKCCFQWRGVVETEFVGRCRWNQQRGWKARHEEPWDPTRRSAQDTQAVQQRPNRVKHRGKAQGSVRRHAVPKLV